MRRSPRLEKTISLAIDNWHPSGCQHRHRNLMLQETNHESHRPPNFSCAWSVCFDLRPDVNSVNGALEVTAAGFARPRCRQHNTKSSRSRCVTWPCWRQRCNKWPSQACRCCIGRVKGDSKQLRSEVGVGARQQVKLGAVFAIKETLAGVVGREGLEPPTKGL